MYRLVPQGLYDDGPNPQPALPQRLHFCSSSSSLLRTYCFWPRLRCTELGCILLSSFSPGDSLNQSPGSLFGSPAASFFGGPKALRSPASRRGCSIHPMRVRMPFSLPSLSMVWTWCGGLPSWVATSSTPGHSPITACSVYRSTEMFTLLDMFLLSCVLR